jgi:hypothetical protein
VTGLVLHGKHEEAERSLRMIRGSWCDEAALKKELDDIHEADALEKAEAKGVSLTDLFRGVQTVNLDRRIGLISETHIALHRLRTFPNRDRIDIFGKLFFGTIVAKQRI